MLPWGIPEIHHACLSEQVLSEDSLASSGMLVRSMLPQDPGSVQRRLSHLRHGKALTLLQALQ